jgi:hypothetical protein
MIDAVFEEHLEHAVGFVLLHPAERCCSKKNPSTLMSRFSKWTCLNHDITSPNFSVRLILPRTAKHRDANKPPLVALINPDHSSGTCVSSIVHEGIMGA